MRIAINLATRPFVDLDRLFQRLRIAIGALAVTAAGLFVWLHISTAQAREQRQELESLHARTAALTAERTRNEARLHQPQNAAVLQQVQFLNALFQRKSFSWTAVLMDLEQVMPSGIMVTSIDPQISSTGQVNIRLRVSGERDAAVKLVRNLEGSHRFIGPRLVGESQQQQQNQGGGRGPVQVQMDKAYEGLNQANPNSGLASTGPPPVDFDIVATYNPLDPAVRAHSRGPAKPSAAEAVQDEGTSNP